MQRYGKGPEDELPLESDGDYTRTIGYLPFKDFTANVSGTSYDNLLNSIWYQPEEVFPKDGTPEEREHAFWVTVDPRYFNISKTLQVIRFLNFVAFSSSLFSLHCSKRASSMTSGSV